MEARRIKEEELKRQKEEEEKLNMVWHFDVFLDLDDSTLMCHARNSHENWMCQGNIIHSSSDFIKL